MVNRIYGGAIAPQEPVRSGQQTRQGGDFHAALQQELQRSEQTREVAFSKHAISRAEQRGIEITPNLIDQLKGGDDLGVGHIDDKRLFRVHGQNVGRALGLCPDRKEISKTNDRSNVCGDRGPEKPHEQAECGGQQHRQRQYKRL